MKLMPKMPKFTEVMPQITEGNDEVNVVFVSH